MSRTDAQRQSSSFARNPRTLTPEEERLLLAGLIADDEGAWRAFNAQYSRLIFRCITRVTGRFSTVVQADDVREIYAVLCIQLLAHDKRRLRSFEPGRGNRLSSWVGMLSIHAAYDYLRGMKREPRRGSWTEAESMTAESPDPFEAFVTRQRAAILAATLSEFSSKDREFIQLYFGEGLDPLQVASRMGISVKTVYSKKHKIRSRLEALLSERRLAA